HVEEPSAPGRRRGRAGGHAVASRERPAQEMDGAVRRSAAVRQGQGRGLQAGARNRDGREIERDRRDREESGEARFREHDRRLRAGGEAVRAGLDDLRRLQKHDELGRLPEGRNRDGAEAGGLQRSDRPEQGAVRPDRRRLRRAGGERPDAGAEAAGLARLHDLRPRRRAPRGGGAAARGGDQPEARHPVHEVLPEPPRRREGLRALPREGIGPRGAARRGAHGSGGGRRSAGAQGAVGDPEHALQHGAVPDVLRPARPARVGVADAEAAQGGAKVTIEPWDYRYYAEKVRKAKYDLDQNTVTPYLQLEKMREAIFWNAGQLFGLQFKPAAGVPVVHPDIRVWEVTDAAGRHVGLWYFDPYARPGKESGAW